MLFKQNLPQENATGVALETLCREQLPVLGFSGAVWSKRDAASAGAVADLEALVSSTGSNQALSFCDMGRHDNVDWLRSENLLLSAIQVPDVALTDLEAVSEASYTQLLTLIAQSSHSHLLRFWNFLPQINRGGGDQETYRRFCTARLRAFRRANVCDSDFPAASAVGHQQQSLTIIALSSKLKPRHHANPMQVDAYRYPRQYGPSSPSFARASSIDMPAGKAYFLSGTASIIGHESLHPNDLMGQLQTTENNIKKMLDNAELSLNAVTSMRVYLRNRSDFVACKDFVEKVFPKADVVYLCADICREELLVEIECICAA